MDDYRGAELNRQSLLVKAMSDSCNQELTNIETEASYQKQYVHDLNQNATSVCNLPGLRNYLLLYSTEAATAQFQAYVNEVQQDSASLVSNYKETYDFLIWTKNVVQGL